ncbi:unnamed protein product [Cuscuta epithymum]|uniref:Uncharacterized protein n=1 Tax=Cuscuta epithymum TaxID=186058 RepID=A0AAV0FDA9_9ASTE|nr:unnamed protein product [Cuscuta epithymum]
MRSHTRCTEMCPKLNPEMAKSDTMPKQKWVEKRVANGKQVKFTVAEKGKGLITHKEQNTIITKPNNSKALIIVDQPSSSVPISKVVSIEEEGTGTEEVFHEEPPAPKNDKVQSTQLACPDVLNVEEVKKLLQMEVKGIKHTKRV